MSARRYRFEKLSQEQLLALEAKYPNAVATITIKKPVYSIIAKLLDCGLEVPGVTIIGDAPAAPLVSGDSVEVKAAHEK